jgi:hypothetical protein
MPQAAATRARPVKMKEDAFMLEFSRSCRPGVMGGRRLKPGYFKSFNIFSTSARDLPSRFWRRP